MDQIGPNGTKWIEYDCIDQIRTTGQNRNKLDQIGPKWTNWTEVDRIGPMWIDLTE